MKLPMILAATLALATPAFAQDADVGEKEFKKCKACHAIVAPDGTDIQKGGKTGPNLYGIVGRQIGAHPDFTAYGDSIVAAGADGKVWDEESLIAYVTDPTAWLKEATGDKGAKSNMSFKLTKKQADMVAYLVSVSPAPEEGEAEAPAAQ